jgi:uncharacterized membrane protein YcaP (DUF421 family)
MNTPKKNNFILTCITMMIFTILAVVNLSQLHLPDWLEIIVRVLSVYFFMIIAIRLFGKKELAQLSVTDLVFILLISNAVQNAMVGADSSLSGGLIAALALFAANYTLKKILYKNESLNTLLQGEAIVLIYKGKIQQENCKKADINIHELEAAVREHGVETIDQVNLGMLEADGNISIISNDFKHVTSHTFHKKHKLKGRLLKN